MTRRYSGSDAKKRILLASIPQFLNNGYSGARYSQIVRMADVSGSSFQHAVGNKEGILRELVRIMFEKQFQTVRKQFAGKITPSCVYPTVLALQLVLAELSENVRDVYLAAYSLPSTLEIISCNRAPELVTALGSYFPVDIARHAYELDLAMSGLLHSFILRKCDEGFSVEEKLRLFLSMSLAALRIPQQEQAMITDSIMPLDLHSAATHLIEHLEETLFDSVSG